jgi:hypothetical protein
MNLDLDLHQRVGALITLATNQLNAAPITSATVKALAMSLADCFHVRGPPPEEVACRAEWASFMWTDLEPDDCDAIRTVLCEPDVFGRLTFILMLNPLVADDASRIAVKLVHAGAVIGPEFLRALNVFVVTDFAESLTACSSPLVRELYLTEKLGLELILLAPTNKFMRSFATGVIFSRLQACLRRVVIYSGQHNIRGTDQQELECLGQLVDGSPHAGCYLEDMNRSKLFANDKVANYVTALPELRQKLSPLAQAAADWFLVLFHAPNVEPTRDTLFKLPLNLSKEERGEVLGNIEEFRQTAKPIYERSIEEYANFLRGHSLWRYVADYKRGTVDLLCQSKQDSVEGPICDSLLGILTRDQPYLNYIEGQWFTFGNEKGDRYTMVAYSDEGRNGLVPLTKTRRARQHFVLPECEPRLLKDLQDMVYGFANATHLISLVNNVD